MGPLLIDITNLQWWQALVAILVGLGLSPAPWIFGLASGKLQFTGPAKIITDERIQDLKDGHAADMAEIVRHHKAELEAQAERYTEMQKSRDGYKVATREERTRADTATEAVANVVEALKATTHFMESFEKATTSSDPRKGGYDDGDER